MIKGVFRLSNHINKRCFTSLSSVSTGSGLGYPFISNKIYKFNLDGTLKTQETAQQQSINQLDSFFDKLSLLNQPQIYNPIIIEEDEQPQTQKKEQIQEMSSILIKRRKKMTKHKYRKLRKRTRALKKRLGKI